LTEKISKYTLVAKSENHQKSLLHVYTAFSRNQHSQTHFVRTRHI